MDAGALAHHLVHLRQLHLARAGPVVAEQPVRPGLALIAVAQRRLVHRGGHQLARPVRLLGDVIEDASPEAFELQRRAHRVLRGPGLRRELLEGQGALGAQPLAQPLREPLWHRARHQHIEGGGAGPAALRPPGEGHRQRGLAQVHRPEHRQARAQEPHPHALRVGQQPGQGDEPLPAEGAHHRGHRARVHRGVALQHQLPRLEDQPGRGARDELEAQRAGGGLGLPGAQREQQVVQIDGRQRARARRERGRGLHLEEAAQPRVGHLHVPGCPGLLGGQCHVCLQGQRHVGAQPVHLGHQVLGHIQEGGAVRGLAALEQGAVEGQARIGALVAGEHLQGHLVRVHREDRIQHRVLLLLGLQRGVQEGLLGLPDLRGGALALLHQVGQVRRAVPAPVAQVAGEDAQGGGQRIPEEGGFADAAAHAHGAARALQGQQHARGVRAGVHVTRGGVAQLDGVAGGGGHEAVPSLRLRARARRARWWARQAALRSASGWPLSKARPWSRFAAPSSPMRPRAARASCFTAGGLPPVASGRSGSHWCEASNAGSAARRPSEVASGSGARSPEARGPTATGSNGFTARAQSVRSGASRARAAAAAERTRASVSVSAARRASAAEVRSFAVASAGVAPASAVPRVPRVRAASWRTVAGAPASPP
ncbi:hypothetical protein STIAU_2847 [Stigmatella aurantiaca DW4/3-1]|uniref:Uncharacterized protein n=1 Tax=Stigmatella aurantiaca (strain DW4/3-1) TaxID=378806 RepID=Q08MF6_STIAD|nr:hypothetical protein STIAU_2847 [Stigmatella aurantiaca DW4/3-1]